MILLNGLFDFMLFTGIMLNTFCIGDNTTRRNTGIFTGSLQGNIHLKTDTTYFCRVRQKSDNGQWSDWSRWHQPFKVAAN
jgi:hypothetical protein